MSRAVIQQALDALENHAGNYKLSSKECDKHNAAIAALRAELAKPDPVTVEREACAYVADWCQEIMIATGASDDCADTARMIAASIRSRSDNDNP